MTEVDRRNSIDKRYLELRKLFHLDTDADVIAKPSRFNPDEIEALKHVLDLAETYMEEACWCGCDMEKEKKSNVMRDLVRKLIEENDQ